MTPSTSITPQVQALFQLLVQRSERSDFLFASPVPTHALTREAKVCMSRFLVFGAGRRQHQALVALLAGAGNQDVLASDFILQFVERLSRRRDDSFPDLVAYPGLDLNTRENRTEVALHALDVDWLDRADPLTTALMADFQHFVYDGFVTVRSNAGVVHPTVQFLGLPEKLARSFDSQGWFHWSLLFEKRLPENGPLSLGPLLPRRAFELRLHLPLVLSDPDFEASLAALQTILYRFAAHASEAYGI
ncbi:MAG: hypothetical protein Q7P63_00095 [Verrucomicrobiota bacterium JB022]|nr:hypothetical protein [Verrucomicrobiota bacterium JB022]